MTKTNPYQVIIDLKLEGDYIQQDSVVELMKEFAKREIESLKKWQTLSIDSVVQQTQQLFCYHKGSYTLNKDGTCCKCHRPPKAK